MNTHTHQPPSDNTTMQGTIFSTKEQPMNIDLNALDRKAKKIAMKNKKQEETKKEEDKEDTDMA